MLKIWADFVADANFSNFTNFAIRQKDFFKSIQLEKNY